MNLTNATQPDLLRFVSSHSFCIIPYLNLVREGEIMNSNEYKFSY